MMTHSPIPETQVGDMVVYVSHGTPVQPDGSQRYRPAERAAIVTSWDGSSADIVVINPSGLFFQRECGYSADGKPGTWHHRGSQTHTAA